MPKAMLVFVVESIGASSVEVDKTMSRTTPG